MYGTVAQLDFLYTKLGGGEQGFYVGASDEEDEGKWVNQEGVDITDRYTVFLGFLGGRGEGEGEGEGHYRLIYLLKYLQAHCIPKMTNVGSIRFCPPPPPQLSA